MEFKEMINLVYYRRWFNLAGIVLIMLAVSSCFGDMTQYKRIGDTKYYLVESVDGDVADLHYYIEKENCFGEIVPYNGFAKDIYWNDKYIMIKCSDRSSMKLINYCIIEQYGRDDEYIPWVVHEYKTKKEFEEAKRKFGLTEKNMNYTDTNIPWRLHW
jgi:hypothetical protein